MYLPALPAMTVDFHASPSAIQMGLAMCILGLAVGQLIFGPLSDKYGRKNILGGALALDLVATVTCILFPATTTLAMSEGKSAVGWAAAIIGATGFFFGGIVTPLVGLGNIQLSAYTALIICAAMICVGLYFSYMVYGLW